jgi:hypothetical protein
MGETNNNENKEYQQESGLADEDRREALKKLGKYAIYTAPAMMAILLPKKCLADSECRENCP